MQQLAERVQALCDALEAAAHDKPTVVQGNGAVRVLVRMSGAVTLSDYQRALEIVRATDDWGQGAPVEGLPTLWGEVRAQEPGQP